MNRTHLEVCAAMGGRRRRAASRRDKGVRTFGARPSARRDSDKLSSFSFSPWLDARRWTARPWTPRIRRQTFGERRRRREIRQHGSHPRATASWDAVASHYPPRRVVRPCRTLLAACPADATIKDKDEPSCAHPRVDCPNCFARPQKHSHQMHGVVDAPWPAQTPHASREHVHDVPLLTRVTLLCDILS